MGGKRIPFEAEARQRVVRVALENAVSIASVPPLGEATMTEIEPPKAPTDRDGLGL